MPNMPVHTSKLQRKLSIFNSIKKRLVKIIMRVRMRISPGIKRNVNFFAKCTIKNEILGKMTA